VRLILPLHVRRLVILVGFALVLPLVLVAPASGAPIDEKKAEAARIANDLEVEGNKVSMAAEGFNQARIQLEKVQSSLAKVQGEMAAADARMQHAQGLLAQVAVQSYVTGGSTSFFAHLAGSDSNNVVLRQQYLRFTASDQRDVMGQVRAARQDFASAQERLDEEQLLAWMGSLNDLRLVLGTRLDVSEDMTGPDPGHPEAALLEIYHYLGFLLEEVLVALDPYAGGTAVEG